jgi:hypothetical protein
MTELFKSLTKSQFLAALKTLNQSIENCNDEIWVAEHIDTTVNQVVFHTLFFTDLYLNQGTDGFKKQQFHLDRPDFFQDYEEYKDRSQTNFYAKSKCVEYIEFCIQKMHFMIDSETQATLSGESGFYWLKFTRAELHIYNTRHIQHHAAQLGLRNQLLDGEPLKWVPRG